MFKVIIVGGEKMGDYPFFKKKCIQCLKNKTKDGIQILSTGDTFVDAFAERFRINVKMFPTNWEAYGKSAIKERNDLMLSECDAFIAFDDNLKTTRIFTKVATERGIPVRSIKKPT